MAKMKILHYSLGFPPYRSGGLTKFCMDIMQEQKRMGHDVALLWPGEMRLLKRHISIKHRKPCQGIDSWEIINPLPISYDEGIVDIEAFTAPCDKVAFDNFLEEHCPDIIHIHTLMGLHCEFINAAKEFHIKVIFSVHDFFTICPKVTLFRKGAICECADSCMDCSTCNLTALSMQKIRILQSPLYRKLKDSPMSKRLRKRHRDQYLSGETNRKIENMKKPFRNSLDYKKLRRYYEQMILKMDVIHYNSTVTKEVFEQFFSPVNTRIISISHSDIKDNRKVKQFGNKLRLTYLGPQSVAKGFFLLKAALDDLWLKGQNFCLNVFFEPIKLSPYIKVHEKYNYSDLKNIFDETDVLIAPSIWNETFGYTVLEALSFGVPVIVSGNVGAKDIIPEGGGIILENIDADALVNTIEHLNDEILNTMNSVILRTAKIKTLSEMTEEIISECYKNSFH